MSHNKLFEGLQKGDLVNCVENIFTVDQFTSKMGNDRDVAVLRFRVKDKFPAIDMMEFIEKGYPFVLDADISSGEERDGRYSVFVEIERSKKLPGQIKNIIEGLTALTDINDWRFRFHKEIDGNDFSEESITENIPLTPDEYDTTLNEQRTTDVKEFFDQGTAEISIDENLNVTFRKPYGSPPLTAELKYLGSYSEIKNNLPGAIQVDEASASQTVFLSKFLGNYEIHKINGEFLVRNGDKAAVIKLHKG
jgi:hypothetical protein